MQMRNKVWLSVSGITAITAITLLSIAPFVAKKLPISCPNLTKREAEPQGYDIVIPGYTYNAPIIPTIPIPTYSIPPLPTNIPSVLSLSIGIPTVSLPTNIPSVLSLPTATSISVIPTNIPISTEISEAFDKLNKCETDTAKNADTAQILNIVGGITLGVSGIALTVAGAGYFLDKAKKAKKAASEIFNNLTNHQTDRNPNPYGNNSQQEFEMNRPANS